MSDNQTPEEDHVAGAVMEAFQVLRNDRMVEVLPVGSQARKRRIKKLLVPVAAGYRLTVASLALSLAKALPYPDDGRNV